MYAYMRLNIISSTQNTSFCDAYLLISAIGGSYSTAERRKWKDGDGMPPSVVNVYAPQPADYIMLSSHRGKSWQQPRVMHQTALWMCQPRLTAALVSWKVRITVTVSRRVLTKGATSCYLPKLIFQDYKTLDIVCEWCVRKGLEILWFIKVISKKVTFLQIKQVSVYFIWGGTDSLCSLSVPQGSSILNEPLNTNVKAKIK